LGGETCCFLRGVGIERSQILGAKDAVAGERQKPGNWPTTFGSAIQRLRGHY
jgi:hypothetical protein